MEIKAQLMFVCISVNFIHQQHMICSFPVCVSCFICLVSILHHTLLLALKYAVDDFKQKTKEKKRNKKQREINEWKQKRGENWEKRDKNTFDENLLQCHKTRKNPTSTFIAWFLMLYVAYILYETY